jgi:hypothetical protein
MKTLGRVQKEENSMVKENLNQDRGSGTKSKKVMGERLKRRPAPHYI